MSLSSLTPQQIRNDSEFYRFTTPVDKDTGKARNPEIDSFSGGMDVHILKDVDTPYEEDVVSNASPVEFAECLVNGNRLDITNMIVSAENGAGAAASVLIEYWDGSGWNVVVRIRLTVNSSQTVAVPITGHFQTGARDATENFFRITNSATSLSTSVTILGHQEQ